MPSFITDKEVAKVVKYICTRVYVQLDLKRGYKIHCTSLLIALESGPVKIKSYPSDFFILKVNAPALNSVRVENRFGLSKTHNFAAYFMSVEGVSCHNNA